MVNAFRQLQLDDLCVHQVSLSGQCDFANSLAVLRNAGVKRTALWTPMIKSCGIAEANRIWDSAGMKAESLCVACLFEDESVLREQLDLADMFGARTLVTITGGFEELKSAGYDANIDYARKLLVERLASAAELAENHQVRLAFEPLHPMVCGFRSIVSTLQESLDILDQMDDSHDIGLAIDTYALWWEHDLQAKLKRAGNRILNYHVSDWLADTRDLRLDRGMPGDGQIALCNWRQMIEKAGYFGPVEIEIFSRDRWWKTPAEKMIDEIIQRMNSAF
ncbi:MAG: sugar phosphate isomerase/epimerase family protein [Candidatus Puniceispirillaceae bacterium]